MLRSAPSIDLASLIESMAPRLRAMQQQLGCESGWASIASSLPDVDPLDVLAAGNDNLQMYWHSGLMGESVAAGGTLDRYETEGENRFVTIKQFVQKQSRRFVELGRSPSLAPRFFAQFSFFNRVSPDYTFPAASITLPRWMVIRTREGCQGTINIRLDRTTNLDKTLTQILRRFQQFDRSRFLLRAPLSDPSLTYEPVSHASSFRAGVDRVLTSIAARRLDKAVLARAVDAMSSRPLRPLEVLRQLRQAHPDCYVFAVTNDRHQTFLGASPECLVRRQGNRAISDALAGSAPRGKTFADDDILARQLLDSVKDRREHDMVVATIARRLRSLKLVPEVAVAPSLMQLPAIQHLHTPIAACVPTSLHLLDLVAALHPTPAVAGSPVSAAEEYIRACESFERGLYAAPIGWVDSNGNGEMAVAIRSGLLSDCRARLYAGAGIVRGSDPDKELHEIHLKLQALVEALT